MNRRQIIQTLAGCSAGVFAGTSRAADDSKSYEMSLVVNGEGAARQWVLLNYRVYNTLGSKKLFEFVATLPAEATIVFNRGCLRSPFHPTDDEVEAFRKWCIAHKIHLVIPPAG